MTDQETAFTDAQKASAEALGDKVIEEMGYAPHARIPAVVVRQMLAATVLETFRATREMKP